MEDLISRQQTITALRALSDEDGYINVPHEVVTDVVRGLPPVKVKQGQTTHSERGESDKFWVKTSETCEDCISRQAAIDAVEFECGEWIGLARTIVKAIEQLPSAQPEQRWIPCGKCIHADGKHRWCKVLDRTINEDYFCYWAEPFREEGEAE